MPRKTAADSLIESRVVVFAREDPDAPFFYKAVEVLKGDLSASGIDLFVNSTVRRVLRANEKHVAVLVRKDENAPWRSLGIADGVYQQVVRRILAFAPDWTGKAGAEKRCEFFLLLFGHENRALFELAYLELGRAPYSTIKRVARLASAEDLRPLFQRREYLEWRALAILMLAQKANERDRAYVEESFADCSRFSLTTNLAAWATAYIELNKERALERIEREYLSNPGRTAEEVRAVVTALSVHARDGHTQLRDQIVRGYETAIKTHPLAADQITKELADLGRDENAKPEADSR
jgi:hypothetical protein